MLINLSKKLFQLEFPDKLFKFKSRKSSNGSILMKWYMYKIIKEVRIPRAIPRQRVEQYDVEQPIEKNEYDL